MIDGAQHARPHPLSTDVEFEIGDAAAVDALQLCALEALRIARHEEQRDAVLVARLAGCARGHDQRVGRAAIEHEDFLAREASSPSRSCAALSAMRSGA